MKWQPLASTHNLSPPVKSGYTLSSCIQLHLKVSLIVATHTQTRVAHASVDTHQFWIFETCFFSHSPLLQGVDTHTPLSCSPTVVTFPPPGLTHFSKDVKHGIILKVRFPVLWQHQCKHTHTHTHKQLCPVDISNLIGVSEFFWTASEHVALTVTHPVPCRSTDNCKYRHSLHFVWRGACEVNLQTLRITAVYSSWHCHMCTGRYCGYRASPDQSCLWNCAGHLPEPPSLCCCCCCCQTLWWSSL